MQFIYGRGLDTNVHFFFSCDLYNNNRQKCLNDFNIYYKYKSLFKKLYIWIMSNENIKLISDLIDVNNSTCNTYKLDQIRKGINIIQIQYSFFWC